MTYNQRTPALTATPAPSLEQGELEPGTVETQQAAQREARLDRREQHLRELERQAAEDERSFAVAIGRSLNKHDR